MIPQSSKEPLYNDSNPNIDYGTDASSSNGDEEQALENNLKETWDNAGSDVVGNHHLRLVADFLVSSTAMPQLVMWGFLAWYLLVVAFFWASLQVKPFLDACVIMILVGLVLNANAFVSFQHSTWSCPQNTIDPSLSLYMRQQTASVVRLFVIPYCVSCYSGIANSTPGFVSIFPTHLSVLISVMVGSIAFPLFLRLMADVTSYIVYPKETNSHRASRRCDGVVELQF